MRWADIDTSSITIDMLTDEGRDLAEVIGLEAYLKLVIEYGGRSVYIHKLDAVRRLVRDEQIRQDFNGYNHAVLCRKYDLSEKQIRLILADRKYRQTSLFDNDN